MTANGTRYKWSVSRRPWRHAYSEEVLNLRGPNGIIKGTVACISDYNKYTFDYKLNWEHLGIRFPDLVPMCKVDIRTSSGVIVWSERFAVHGSKKVKIQEEADELKIDFLFAYESEIDLKAENDLKADIDFKAEIDISARPKALFADFGSSLLDDSDFSDAVILCQNREFPVHKVILAGRSEVLKRMLAGDFREAREGKIELHDYEPDVVKHMARFIYKDDVEEEAISWSLFEAAAMFELSDLKQMCLDGLSKDINTENCCTLLEMAFRYDLDKIFDLAMAYFRANKMSVAKTPEWEKMKNNKELMAKIVLLA
jgi:speckle-type POZ protein